MIEQYFKTAIIESIGWTLLHSIWQGAVFAGLLVVLLLLSRKLSSNFRYLLNVSVLLGFFITVCFTFLNEWKEAEHRCEVSACMQLNSSVNSIDNKSETSLPLVVNNTSQQLDEIEAVKESSTFLNSSKEYFKGHIPLLVSFWILGVLFLQLRFLGQLVYVQRLKNYGTEIFPDSWMVKIQLLEERLQIRRSVAYLKSIKVSSPMVVGCLRPAVIFPKQLFEQLTETEIYAVLAHELAHIKREDFIINLMQGFLCNVFFFNPSIWWISNRVDDEREHCCDDLAVAVTGGAKDYAMTLINVSQYDLVMKNNPHLALALKGKRNKESGFSKRIKRLFGAQQKNKSFKEGMLLAFLSISALSFSGLAIGSTNDQGLNQRSLLEPECGVDSTIVENENEMALLNLLYNQNLNSVVNYNKEEESKPTSQSETITTTTTVTTTISDDTYNAFIQDEADWNKLPVASPVAPVLPNDFNYYFNKRIEALIIACDDGDFELVEILVGAGLDVNGIGQDGFTPLMVAVNNDHEDIVEYLIKNGAKVNQSVNGWTALIEAADEGAINSMELLLKNGAEVNYFGNAGSPTAIAMAASEGHLSCLKLLNQFGADLNGVSNSIPPLHIAAEEDKRDILNYLIDQGVDLNKKDVYGRTAIMYAASEGHDYVVEKLIKAGADKSMLDSQGLTAQDYAEEEGERSVVNLLDSKEPLILEATRQGLIERVEKMVEEGADINTTDEEGQTALHIAAALNHNIDVQVLIDLGADINARDNDGRTPLMYAAAGGQEFSAKTLIKNNADVHIEDDDEMRAFEWAKFGRNKKLMELIGDHTNRKSSKQELKKEAIKRATGQKESFHINPTGTHLKQYNIKNGQPSILQIVQNGSVRECRKLLDKGVSPNETDDTGQSALMIAARNNYLEIAQLLLDEGADVNNSSDSGLTALHYAALENHDEMVQLLVDHNADVDATLRYSSTDGNFTEDPLVWEYVGATPLLIAVESNNYEVALILLDTGANPFHQVKRIEYKFDEDRVHYLTAPEVMGLDMDFLNEVEHIETNNNWTPYQQAQYLSNPKILALFEN